MAVIGLRYFVSAKIASETAGQPITYENPIVCDHPMAANVAWQRGDTPLYGGDVIAENDNSITGGNITVGLDDLTPEFEENVLGAEKVGTAPNDYLEDSEKAAAPVGCGYIRVKKRRGALVYQSNWVHKTQFAQNEESTATKGQKIEWQTPSIVGTIMGVLIDATGIAKFRRKKEHTTYAAAKTWIDTIAGISSEPVATPTANPAAGQVASGSTVALSTTTSGASIYYTLDGSTPSASSTLYTAPIEITAGVTIKAIGVKAGQPDSTVLTAAYTIAG